MTVITKLRNIDMMFTELNRTSFFGVSTEAKNFLLQEGFSSIREVNEKERKEKEMLKVLKTRQK